MTFWAARKRQTANGKRRQVAARPGSWELGPATRIWPTRWPVKRAQCIVNVCLWPSEPRNGWSRANAKDKVFRLAPNWATCPFDLATSAADQERDSEREWVRDRGRESGREKEQPCPSGLFNQAQLMAGHLNPPRDQTQPNRNHQSRLLL